MKKTDQEKIMVADIFHLAEFNIGRINAPLDAPQMKEFTDFLAPVNLLAEQSPGFVWRFTAPDGQASSYVTPIYADEMIVPNLSVWRDIQSLRDFVFQTVHVYFLRNRKKWFEHFPSRQVVLWWIPAGHIPTLDEAKQKLAELERNGPAPSAFTMQHAFDFSGNPIKKDADGE